jgi:hypothetical protein
MTAIEWLQIDGYGQVINTFRGTHEALCSKLMTESAGVGNITTKDQQIYLRAHGSIVECTMVALNTPWGIYKYIPSRTVHV